MTGFCVDEQIVSQIEAEWPCPNGSWAPANWWSWPKCQATGSQSQPHRRVSRTAADFLRLAAPRPVAKAQG